MERYNFKIIETKWQKYWEEKKLSLTKNILMIIEIVICEKRE